MTMNTTYQPTYPTTPVETQTYAPQPPVAGYAAPPKAETPATTERKTYSFLSLYRDPSNVNEAGAAAEGVIYDINYREYVRPDNSGEIVPYVSFSLRLHNVSRKLNYRFGIPDAAGNRQPFMEDQDSTLLRITGWGDTMVKRVCKSGLKERDRVVVGGTLKRSLAADGSRYYLDLNIDDFDITHRYTPRDGQTYLSKPAQNHCVMYQLPAPTYAPNTQIPNYVAAEVEQVAVQPAQGYTQTAQTVATQPQGYAQTAPGYATQPPMPTQTAPGYATQPPMPAQTAPGYATQPQVPTQGVTQQPQMPIQPPQMSGQPTFYNEQTGEVLDPSQIQFTV